MTETTTDTAATLTSENKADFTDIYRAPDPRGYFRALHPLSYQVPLHARPIVRAALAAASEGEGRPSTVLDVCCSYGINAALLRHEVDLETLALRYTDSAWQSLAPAELIAADRAFYAATLRPDAPEVVGLDVSERAVDYGVRTGLMRRGFAEDLESAEPSQALRAAIADTGVVVCTGGVGYIGAKTFARLLESVRAPHRPWFVVFVLRVFPYDEVAAALAAHGFVTEKVPGTFRQRRFADRAEQSAAVLDVERLGLDPAGKEADGWYHAECFVSRPADAARRPLAELLR